MEEITNQKLIWFNNKLKEAEEIIRRYSKCYWKEELRKDINEYGLVFLKKIFFKNIYCEYFKEYIKTQIEANKDYVTLDLFKEEMMKDVESKFFQFMHSKNKSVLEELLSRECDKERQLFQEKKMRAERQEALEKIREENMRKGVIKLRM